MKNTRVFLVPNSHEPTVAEGIVKTDTTGDFGQTFVASVHDKNLPVIASWGGFSDHTAWAGFTDPEVASTFAQLVRNSREAESPSA